jgi:hypothetical protein
VAAGGVRLCRNSVHALDLVQRPLVHLKVGKTPFQPSDLPEHDRAQKPRRSTMGWTARAALQPIVRRTA